MGRQNDEKTKDSQRREGNEPFCRNCGYTLTGATESAKCPECGLPLVEVLTRPTFETGQGKRWRSKARLRGLPVIDIAFGPSGIEAKGTARGFIAIGDDARGWLAIGGQARGFLAIGGGSMGVFAIGGMSLGIFSFGGLSIGTVSMGGFAIGLLARGGGALALMAEGGMAIGLFARGGGAFGVHRIWPGGASDVATRWFDAFPFFFGPWPPSFWSMITGMMGMVLIMGAVAGVLAAIAGRAYLRDPGRA